MRAEPSSGAGVGPLAFAIGIAVALVGLVIDPPVIAPLGAAIALAGVTTWIRRRPSSASAKPESVEEVGERFPRRRLLERATLGLGGLVALGIGLPTAGFALLPSFTASRQRPVDLGPIEDFPQGQYVVATFLTDPHAGEVSRRAAYVRNNGFLGDVPSFTVISSRCTHVGCPTQPNGPIFTQQRQSLHTENGEVGLVPTQPAGFGCPCHGSQFDTEGNRTAGPAPRPLDRYQFSIRNGRLSLGPVYSVGRVDGTGAQAKIHAYRRTGDGEPVTGIESLLYPIAPPS